MAKYLVPVTWTASGNYKEVDAESFQAATDKILEAAPGFENLPQSPEYVDDSMEIDYGTARELNDNLTDDDKAYIKSLNHHNASR